MNINELDNIKVFFILGRPRSGTTLLRTLLDAHTNVNIPYEARIIMDLYFKYGKIKQWNEIKLTNFYNDALSIKKVKDWEFNENLKQQIISLGNKANFSRLIKLVYINFKSLFKKGDIIFIGDKNPHYSIRKSYYKIFKEIFPDAKIIHLVRDYRAHYLSMSKMDFENTQIGNVAWRWVYSYKIIKSAFGNYPNYIFLRHEDLTKNPEQELKQLCTFLNIEYQPSMLDFYKLKDIAIEKYGEEALKVHSSLFNPVTDIFNDKWKTNLTDKQIKYLDASVGKTAEEAGYKRIYYAKQTKLKLLFYKLHTYLFLIYANLLDYFPLKLKRYFLGKTDFLAYVFNIFLKK